ncbi:ferredoxin [Mycolicibacterium wolinskyi]|uniref:ferredoxin n=1 Tax=Mycolicibacterium wolinskyi TaxID=59750 RepID=UPI0039177533
MSEDPSWHELRVDGRLCEGHALCIDLAPDVFVLGDDEVAAADATPPESRWGRVKAAVDACPRQAITFSTLPTKGR